MEALCGVIPNGPVRGGGHLLYTSFGQVTSVRVEFLLFLSLWLCQAPKCPEEKNEGKYYFDWKRIDEIFSCSPIGIGTAGSAVTVRIHDYRIEGESDGLN